MGELKEYLTLLNRVRSDQTLMHMIDAYEETAQKLVDLLQSSDYDASEAIRLTNDADYLSHAVKSYPLYQQYISAKAAFDESVALRRNRSVAIGCNCSMQNTDHKDVGETT